MKQTIMQQDQSKSSHDLFGNQRVPNCSYYEPPQHIYSNHDESSYYKDPYMPESVEVYNQIQNSQYSYQNLDDEIKSEPMDYLNQANHLHLDKNISHPNYIDHDQIEKFKVERKRERNRIAASKCRQRKIDRIQQLEEQVDRLKQERAAFEEESAKLKAELEYLKRQLKDHTALGCKMERPSFLGPDSTCKT